MMAMGLAPMYAVVIHVDDEEVLTHSLYLSLLLSLSHTHSLSRSLSLLRSHTLAAHVGAIGLALEPLAW